MQAMYQDYISSTVELTYMLAMVLAFGRVFPAASLFQPKSCVLLCKQLLKVSKHSDGAKWLKRSLRGYMGL